jgi:30S ribosomal protein S31
MGKGDKRSRRGKIFKASYGNARPQKVSKVTKPATSGTAAKKTATTKKTK